MDSQMPAAAKSWLPFRPFDLVSRQPRAECVARLTAATRDTGSLTGWVNEDRIRVGWRDKPLAGAVRMRNSVRPYLYAKLEDAAGGTVLHCHFTLHPLVLGIFAVVSVFAVFALFLKVWAFAAGMIFVMAFGTFASAYEREFILNQLEMTIGTHPR